jgi:hypothetical protein
VAVDKVRVSYVKAMTRNGEANSGVRMKII